MGKRVLFVLNPTAGRGEIRTHLLEVIQLLTEAGYSVTVHPTSGAGQIPDLLRESGGSYDLILTSGGDGTLNETVSGLMDLDPRPLLAYIPAGTVNDTAANLHLPLSILPAAEIAVKGTPSLMDVQSFNDKWFFYVAAFGLFTDVAYATPQEQKHVWGRLAYLMQGVRALSDIKVYRVRVETPEETLEESVIFGAVCSTTSVGGFHPSGIRDRVDLHDGLSEVLLVRQPRNLADFSSMASALLRLDFDSPYFFFAHASSVRFTFEDAVPWTLDGEYGGTVQAAVIRNHPGALRFMV
ncbi:MAG: diacylglycerol kinase family lipid kinase, partial [Oscillospiraceae bacterium]|nr:diacylglycerol kinase family lipid kinase [Oscillospiraceae bacterium]